VRSAPTRRSSCGSRSRQDTVKGPRLLIGQIILLARPGPPAGRGDPARFDTSRPPMRPNASRRRDSASRDDQDR
jgi:hypothetical protein